MKRVAVLFALLCTGLWGCASPPVKSPAASPHVPSITVAPQSSGVSPGDAFEERHRARARASVSEGNWADALVHWELLALVRPTNPEYREALAETRANIARQAAHLMQLAELARKQGNLDQAELWFLRVLNIDREHAAAAQALRDTEADRTKRAYSNRPPRIRMQ
jgi:tetratricopeptide (TPR) repeat protein